MSVRKNVVLAASAARTVTGNGADVDVSSFLDGILFLNVSANGGVTPTLDIKVDAKDPVSGAYVELAAFAQVTTTNGISKLNLARPISGTIRVRWVITGTSPTYTFSVSGDFSRR